MKLKIEIDLEKCNLRSEFGVFLIEQGFHNVPLTWYEHDKPCSFGLINKDKVVGKAEVTE